MLASKFWPALPNNQQRLEEIITICAFLCLCRSHTRGVCIIHICTESKHHEINTDFKGKVASREHLNTTWMTEDVYTWFIGGGLSLFIHEPAHPNATAKNKKCFTFHFWRVRVVKLSIQIHYCLTKKISLASVVEQWSRIFTAQRHWDPLKSHQLHQQVISSILSTSFRWEMN